MSLNQRIVDLMRDIKEIAMDEHIDRALIQDVGTAHIDMRVKSVLAKRMAEHIVEQPKTLHHAYDVLTDNEIYRIRGIWVDREDLYTLLERAYELGRTPMVSPPPAFIGQSAIGGGSISAAPISPASVNTSTVTAQMINEIKYQYESAMMARERYLREQQTESQLHQTINQYGKEWKI